MNLKKKRNQSGIIGGINLKKSKNSFETSSKSYIDETNLISPIRSRNLLPFFEFVDLEKIRHFKKYVALQTKNGNKLQSL